MDDRVKMAERRKLIFQNLVNGVPQEALRETFQATDKEIGGIFEYVTRKVRSYRFERGMPFVKCDTVDAARRNQALVLHTLERLNLSKDPKFSKIESFGFGPEPESGRLVTEALDGIRERQRQAS